LIGKTITLPLVGREIPIIGDDYVDREFGTGCVKITPAHDFNDYAVGTRHNLPLHNIFTIDAKINCEAPAAYQGLERYDARKQIVVDLDALGLLGEVKPHKLMVPRGDRSGSVIEPLLTDQWYVKATEMAKPAIDAVKNGEIEFVPKQWENTYYEWMNNIQDWCISRQIWWGHRIPAWYDDQGHVYVARDEHEAKQKAAERGYTGPLTQDEDVLDTWFSSALWPFSTLGWPQNTDALKTFYPTQVLVTGFDIIFFWVARMIMMGLHFTKEVPFKQVYVHGLVRDGEGQKMSKSKGNVLDPIDLIDGISLEDLVTKRTYGMMQPEKAANIEKATRKQFADGIPAFGTDALRFTFASLASTGRDIRFDLQRCEGYRNFCNKLWNASRFVMMNVEGKDCGAQGGEVDLSLADQWIISRLQRVEAEVAHQLENYRLDLASQAIYEFTWNEYCDWYLELTKPILNNADSTEAQLRGTRITLVRVLETLLRLAHPLIPFITEEIWQSVAPIAGKTGETIMLAAYPVSDDSLINPAAEAELEWVKAFINGIRSIRSQMDIAPSKPLSVLLDNLSAKDGEYATRNTTFLKALARLESIEILSGEVPQSAMALVGDMKILIPMAGLIDVEAERARLEKEIGKLEKEVERVSGKLNNAGFVSKAPAEVLDKEREKLAGYESSLSSLKVQLDGLDKV